MSFYSHCCGSRLRLPNYVELLIVLPSLWHFGVAGTPEKEFKPLNILDILGQPLPRLWLCDGAWEDARNAEDESASLCSHCVGGYGFPCDCLEDDGMCENCVRKNQVCDGTIDCADGSDETDCGNNSTCAEDERPCRSNRSGGTVCTAACTGNSSPCANLEDQFNCTTRCSGEHLFLCNNTKCIPRSWLCDGANDCGDWSDEENCVYTEPLFNCTTSGRSVPARRQCDRISDCPDHSDEISPAAGCKDHTWYCLLQMVGTSPYRTYPQGINASMVCNGVVDCENGADEENCVPSSTETTTDQTTTNNELWTPVKYNETITFPQQQSTVKPTADFVEQNTWVLIGSTVISLVVLIGVVVVIVIVWHRYTRTGRYDLISLVQRR